MLGVHFLLRENFWSERLADKRCRLHGIETIAGRNPGEKECLRAGPCFASGRNPDVSEHRAAQSDSKIRGRAVSSAVRE